MKRRSDPRERGIDCRRTARSRCGVDEKAQAEVRTAGGVQ
jgi:hypothetical protein